MGNTRKTPIGYHGIQNVKFAPKTAEGYSEDHIPLSYAKSLNFSSLLEDTEIYADNHLLARLPNDKGYTIEIGGTAASPEFDLAAGYSLMGDSGVIGASVAQYFSGALYYEFVEIGPDKRSYTVKAWLYNVDVGKGAPSHATDTKSLELGDYKYPGTLYGTPIMSATGENPYLDALGMGRMAFTYTSLPGEPGYDEFGAAVPVPKVAAPGDGG